MEIDNTKKESRAELIQSIQTPLGFFSLAVLVTEVILGVLASKATGLDVTILIVSMVVLMFSLVSIVAYTSFKHPLALTGNQNHAPEKHYSELKKENERLEAELQRITSLKTRVWSALHQSHTVDIHDILKYLGYSEQAYDLKRDIIGILGLLLEEGKIKRDKHNSFHYIVPSNDEA
jgi:hypothetical protein